MRRYVTRSGSFSDERGHWAGVPIPLDTHDLIVEPKYPYAEGFKAMAQQRKPERDTEADDGVKVRNSFWSMRLRGTVYIFEEDGKIKFVVDRQFHSITHALMTLGASDVWGVEQEGNAVNTLASLLRHRQFKQYMLTGMFMERSKRSGLTYLFRRLRPTVVLDCRNQSSTEPTRMLCALCMHPIAYYSVSWAGAMCPTDDVLSHLMMMRADEHMLWRRSNQHPPYRPEAGL